MTMHDTCTPQDALRALKEHCDRLETGEDIGWVIDGSEVVAMRADRWIWYAPIPDSPGRLCRVLLDLEEKVWFDKWCRGVLLGVLERHYRGKQ